jgi:hypothetical protein
MAGLDPAIHVVQAMGIGEVEKVLHRGDGGTEEQGDSEHDLISPCSSGALRVSVVMQPFRWPAIRRMKHVDGRVKPGHDG